MKHCIADAEVATYRNLRMAEDSIPVRKVTASDAAVQTVLPSFDQPKSSLWTPQYIWQSRFEAAVVETDVDRLKTHIEKARESMRKRLGALKPRASVAGMDEYQAIKDAEVILRALERETKTEAKS